MILPAIKEAFYGLQNVDTRYKHVLILTDGGVDVEQLPPWQGSVVDWWSGR